MRHFDVQMIGGIVLHQGKITEMRTGEGKTLVATLAAYLNALSGGSVHVITVNDYLAKRDAEWMAPLYQALGMSIGIIQSFQGLRYQALLLSIMLTKLIRQIHVIENKPIQQILSMAPIMSSVLIICATIWCYL